LYHIIKQLEKIKRLLLQDNTNQALVLVDELQAQLLDEQIEKELSE